MPTCCSEPRNPCPQYPDTHCIVYTGSNLPCIGAKTNERLDSILTKIDAIICTIYPPVPPTQTVLQGIGCVDVTGTGTTDDPYIIEWICAADFESPLTFNNALTRTADNVQWGGTLVHNTSVAQAGFDINFSNGHVGFNTVAPPTRTITIGSDDGGTRTLFLFAPDGGSGWVQATAGAALSLVGGGQTLIRPTLGTGYLVCTPTNDVELQWWNTNNYKVGVIGVSDLDPGVSREWYFKTYDNPNSLIDYLALYDRIKLRNIPQNDVAPKVIAIDGDDNVRYIDAGVLGGGSSTAINVATLSGTGAAITFTIPHGLSGTPKFLVTAASTAAAGISYSTVDATNITIHYAVAPVLGTNNVIINWSANL